MDSHDELSFLTAFGQELCGALSPPVLDDLIVPQDAFEVWIRAFGTRPTPEALASLTDTEVERLHAACVGNFECPDITESQVRLAHARTLWRWPGRDLSVFSV